MGFLNLIQFSVRLYRVNTVVVWAKVDLGGSETLGTLIHTII
jgi:hypothetical protein